MVINEKLVHNRNQPNYLNSNKLFTQIMMILLSDVKQICNIYNCHNDENNGQNRYIY